MPEVNYFWDEIEDNVVREYDENNNTIASYTTEPTLYGSVLSQDRGGEKRYFQFDGLGNTTELTDVSGGVTDTRRYSSFGGVSEATGVGDIAWQWGGRLGYHVTLTVGIYVRRRFYTFSLLRWLSVDPLVSTSNHYLYCRNNALVNSDPSGANPVAIGPPVALIGAGVVVTAAEIAAAQFSLTVLACLASAACRDAMKAAVQAAVNGLTTLTLGMLTVHCKQTYEHYKILEELCDKCNVGKGVTLCERAIRCAHATPNLACWTAVAGLRLQYILSGCDFVVEVANFEGHAQAALDASGAVARCATSINRNCPLFW